MNKKNKPRTKEENFAFPSFEKQRAVTFFFMEHEVPLRCENLRLKGGGEMEFHDGRPPFSWAH